MQCRGFKDIKYDHHNHDYNKQRWAAALPPWGSLQARYQSPEPPRSWDYSPKWGLLISFHMDVLIFGMHRSVLSSQVIWRISWRRSMPSWTQGLLVCWSAEDGWDLGNWLMAEERTKKTEVIRQWFYPTCLQKFSYFQPSPLLSQPTVSLGQVIQ